MTRPAVVHFPLKKGTPLAASEKKVTEKLTKAAEAIAPIYEKQVNALDSQANFYPADATKDEIQQAAKSNSKILSPYTMVERDLKGRLTAIPYHIKFRDELLKVASLIEDAAKISDNFEFSKRLKVQANALMEGKYETSDIYWLSMKPYKINFVIGPIERYEDRLFFTKCAYQSWLGVMDKKQTEDAILFRDFIVSSRRKVLVPSEKVEFMDKIQIRVDDMLVFSGLIARFMFTSSNLPNDVNLMEKYGSEATIFNQSFNNKFNKRRYPIFLAVFEENFKNSYPRSLLRQGSLRNSYLHEISHPLLRYRDAEKRLQEYFPIFDEISASVLGVKACGSLLLKDIISQKELEAIMVMFIALAFCWWMQYLDESGVIHYAQGFAMALNFFLESGAIRESKGFSWPNFAKLFVSIDQLDSSLERILSVGTYEDAKKFTEQYGSLEIFERFRPNLKNLI